MNGAQTSGLRHEVNPLFWGSTQLSPLALHPQNFLLLPFFRPACGVARSRAPECQQHQLLTLPFGNRKVAGSFTNSRGDGSGRTTWSHFLDIGAVPSHDAAMWARVVA
jgi:hypothetical protein